LIAIERFIAQYEEVCHVGASFFEISKNALFNDMIAHAIKVLDKNKNSATFWYILKTDETRAKTLKIYSEEKLQELHNLTKKLKLVRDKTHFHIDRESVLDSSSVWKDADISGNELSAGLEYLFEFLLELRNDVFNEKASRNNYLYKGDDVIRLLELAKENNIIKVIEKSAMKELAGS